MTPIDQTSVDQSTAVEASGIWTPPGGAVITAQDRRTAPHNELFPSPLNPRKHFDDAELRGLAQTIAEQGVLQNLTVRPGFVPDFHQKPGFEIAAGERRWRAVGLLIAAGHAPADYPMPIVVRDMTDAEFVTLAMIENLDRDDLTDLEQARGFKVMAESMSTDSIAIKVGKSPRFIQQRLNLITKAAPELVQALEDGNVTFSQARAAVFASTREQVKIVKEIAANPTLTEQAVKTRAIGGIPNVSAAFFDRAQYKGEIVRDDDIGAEYFADTAEFAKLQRAAAEERQGQLIEEGAAWAQVFDYAKKQFFNETLYAKKPGHAQAGVAIEIRINHHVVIHRDLVLLKDLEKGSPRSNTASTAVPGTKGEDAKASRTKPAEKTDPLDSFTPAHRVHAHMRKTDALQMALANNPLMAKRLLCFTLLLVSGGYNDHEEITRIGLAPNNRVQGFKDMEFEIATPVQAALIKHAPQHLLTRSAVEVWKFFAQMDEKKVDSVLAALVAEQCGTWCMDSTPLDDADIVVAVANSLKLNDPAKHTLPLVPGDLEGLRKPALLAVARHLKATDAHDGMTADQLRDICAHHLKKGHKGLQLPTLQFLSEFDMEKACTAFVAPPKSATETLPKIAPTSKAKTKPVALTAAAHKAAHSKPAPAKSTAKPAAKPKKKAKR